MKELKDRLNKAVKVMEVTDVFGTDVITIIKSAILLISSVLVILAAIGILRYRDDLERVIYARIHILGIADVACILALLVMGEILLATAYFILTPFNSHAIANAYYYGEEKR